jgi:hypothetical protein
MTHAQEAAAGRDSKIGCRLSDERFVQVDGLDAVVQTNSFHRMMPIS